MLACSFNSIIVIYFHFQKQEARMFFRKLLGTNNEAKVDNKAAQPSGMQPMGPSLQRKFAKGVHYNSMFNNIAIFITSVAHRSI